MRRAIAALLVTAVVTILLLSFRTRAPQLRVAGQRAPAAAAKPAPSGGASTSGSGISGTAVGDDVQHQYGDVQVKATVRNGSVVAVETVAMNGDGGRSQQIDAVAEPLLRAEALQAHSAQIDAVSGASYTSAAYVQSLQSAIDKVRAGG